MFRVWGLGGRVSMRLLQQLYRPTLYGRFGLLFSSFKGVGSHCIHSFLVRAGDL